MKKHLILIAALALGVLTLSACGNKDNPQEEEPQDLIDLLYPNGQDKKDLEIKSTAMKQTMKYSVWLPPKFDANKAYPILYLLHGYGDDNNSWLSNTTQYGMTHGGNAAEIAARYVKTGGTPMIIVMPDGLVSFYRGDYETYLHEELMPKVEKDYKFSGKRAVAGLSMGGCGTLYHALKYPSKFTYAYAMSPACDASMAEMVTDPKILPGITVETGEADTTTPMSGITPFVEAMRAKGVNMEYITVPKYGHEWTFWRACLPHALQKAGESFK